MKLRVAGAQMAVGRDIEANKTAILAAIGQAADEHADVLLTPEGSLSGYTHEFDAAKATQALSSVTAFAREKRVGLALGICFVEQDGQCYNQIRFYGSDGRYLGFHSKTLRCGSMEASPKGEINHYGVTDLRTFEWTEDCAVGGLICNDLWANPACTPMPDPHLTHQLAGLGARIVFHAVNGGRDGSAWSEVAWQYHESNLRMRARAGNLWIVTVDSCAPTHLPCSSPSGVIDPKGEWVCKTASVGEQFFIHTIETDQK